MENKRTTTAPSRLRAGFVGAGFMVTLASTNTILQTIVTEELRGRVMAFYTMAFLGTAPLGSLLAGGLADRIGAPGTIRLGGIACIAAGAWYARRLPGIRRLVRPIYVERGILVLEPEGAPQVAPRADTGAA